MFKETTNCRLAQVVKTWTRVWTGHGFKSSLGYFLKF